MIYRCLHCGIAGGIYHEVGPCPTSSTAADSEPIKHYRLVLQRDDFAALVAGDVLTYGGGRLELCLADIGFAAMQHALSTAEKRNRRAESDEPKKVVFVRAPLELIDRLKCEAARRKISINALAVELLTAAAAQPVEGAADGGSDADGR